jgi:hypothetical protein
MIIELDEITNQLLIIKGNWLQSLRRRNGSCRWNVISNSLQAIGEIYELENNNEKKDRNNKDGQLLEVLGSWIQAIGSVISAISQTKEEKRWVEAIYKGSYETNECESLAWCR